jgi:hypothetical protein
MLTIRAGRQKLCDGWSRRDFLRAGALGAGGLSLAHLIRAGAGRPGRVLAGETAAGFGRAKRAMLLFLTGGPPQHDTWDMKPDAAAEVRGELSPIDTNVPGIRISELFPLLARQTDKYCIVRSVTHHDSVHTSAGYTMLTGVYHPTPNEATAENIRPLPTDHPHLGSILSAAHPARQGLPPFVSLPEIIRDAGVNTFPGQDGGFLGKQFGPFRVEADEPRTRLELPGIGLPDEITAARLADRQILLERLDGRLRTIERQTELYHLNSYYSQAFSMVASPAARQAFDIEREPEALRESYGRHLFGQGCLLARRLLEAGVSLATVYWHYEGPEDSPVWDTHQNNYRHLRNRLMPPTDQAVSALLADLADRGMLADTLVDHWAQSQSILLAGAGIRGGSVYGASDRIGAYPADSPVTPPDLAATILHLLGVPLDLQLTDAQGRVLPACTGMPVAGLW